MSFFSAYPSFVFFRRPFVFIFLCFGAGLLVEFSLDEGDHLTTFFTVLCALLIAGFFFLLKRKHFFLPLILFCFFISGALLMRDRMGADHLHLSDNKSSEYGVAIVKIVEIGDQKREWKKMTGTILEWRKQHHSEFLKERVVLFVQAEQAVFRAGDILLVSAPFQRMVNQGNPGEFDAVYFWRSKGIRRMAFVGKDQFSLLHSGKQGWLKENLDKLRVTLQQKLKEQMSGDELAIALALILGDKSLLDTEVKNSFINTGAMHVLAVSGLHIGIIMQILLYILSLFPRIFSKRSAILIVVTIMWVYALITGLSPSVLRAVFMFSVLVLSQLTQRNDDPLNTLCFTGFILCLLDPFTLFDIGFQLSFLAMIGIFLLYKPIEQLLFFNQWMLRKVWQGTAIGFAAQLMTTPLSLYYFHQFPNYFVLTNIGLMASSGIILGGGLVMFGLGWIGPVGQWCGWLLTKSVFFSLGFIRWVESLPGAVAYGFDLGLLTVSLSVLWVLIVFLVKFKPQVKRWFYVFGLLLLASIVYTRYQHITLREVCVLQMKFPVILVKSGNDICCFHDADKDEMDKLNFAVEAYRKLFPGEVRYLSMKRNWKLEGTEKLVVHAVKGGKFFNVNGKQFFLLTRNGKVDIPETAVRIGMPWVRTNLDHSLKDGAYRYVLQ